MNAPESKTCALCKQHKPLEDYFRCSRNADGRMWRCKDCVNAKQRTYNVDLDRERETKAAHWQAYWSQHADRLREQNRAWAARHPDRKRRASRKPHLMRLANQRRRAMLLNAYVEDVPFDYIVQRDLGICGICREAVMENTAELDHIVPLVAGGMHERSNIQLAHRSCNRRKWTKVDQAVRPVAPA